MVQKRRFLDVWIVESDTVYREVPYEVTTDWIQQGRLLDDDMLRWSGQAEWFRLGSTPAFAAYMPRAEPDRAEDQAEALEPVHVDFSWKRPRDEDEGEVDMIPLIDVSLVLLVFFMMTTAVATPGLYFKTPPADNGLVASGTGLYWVGVDFKRSGARVDKHTLLYAVGKGDEVLKRWDDVPDTDDARGRVLDEIAQTLREQQGTLTVNIKAEEDVPSGLVRDLTRKLEGMGATVEHKYVGVSKPKS